MDSSKQGSSDYANNGGYRKHFNGFPRYGGTAPKHLGMGAPGIVMLLDQSGGELRCATDQRHPKGPVHPQVSPPTSADCTDLCPAI